MINFIISLTTLFTLSIFGAFEWIGEFISAHYLATAVVAILGLIIANVSSQLRTVLESVENIIALYAQYTHPESESGKKLSEDERRRLLELCLKELRSLVNHFSTGIIAKSGRLLHSLALKVTK